MQTKYNLQSSYNLSPILLFVARQNYYFYGMAKYSVNDTTQGNSDQIFSEVTKQER